MLIQFDWVKLIDNNKRGVIKIMKQTAYAFMIVATVLLAFAIIPLAWCIPMTIRAKKKIPGAPRTIGLGVCAILFMGNFWSCCWYFALN